MKSSASFDLEKAEDSKSGIMGQIRENLSAEFGIKNIFRDIHDIHGCGAYQN